MSQLLSDTVAELPARAADHAEPVSRRHHLQHRLRHRAGAAAVDRGAACRGAVSSAQQYEHAIAVLTGHPPAELTIPPAPLPADVPVVPPGLPSALLERRPDIAAAERTMQQQNALIGVQVAAYYPDISLVGPGRLCRQPAVAAVQRQQPGVVARRLRLRNAVRRRVASAPVAAARATYDAAVANYRQTVLTAFQQVEDALVQPAHPGAAGARGGDRRRLDPARGGCHVERSTAPGRSPIPA